MRKPTSHMDLLVWKKAMELVLGIYRYTSGFPDVERYGLVAQLRRAAVSIPANVAEGSGRFTSREFAQFVSIARGSAVEIETLLLLTERLEYSTPEETRPLLLLSREISRMLLGLRRSLLRLST